MITQNYPYYSSEYIVSHTQFCLFAYQIRAIVLCSVNFPSLWSTYLIYTYTFIFCSYQIIKLFFFLTVFNEKKIEIQSENSPEIGGSCRESMFMSSDTGKIRKAAHLGMDNLNTGRFCSPHHTDPECI